MARILAIDYGLKRTGLAVTDPLQIIASGLATVSSPNTIEYLKDYLQKEAVERFVIGLPIQMNGKPSESVPLILKFIKILKKTFPDIPVSEVDERFTSKIATQSMVQQGLKKRHRQNKALVDMVSATLILQNYLAQ